MCKGRPRLRLEKVSYLCRMPHALDYQKHLKSIAEKLEAELTRPSGYTTARAVDEVMDAFKAFQAGQPKRFPKREYEKAWERWHNRTGSNCPVRDLAAWQANSPRHTPAWWFTKTQVFQKVMELLVQLRKRELNENRL